MTLGLAYGNDSAIYGTMDSFGTSADGMQDKILVFPSGLMLLVAGGMFHWRDALNDYTPHGSVDTAAPALAQTLDRHMTKTNQAFGLLCGYESSEPVCYRLNRVLGADTTTLNRECLDEVRPIGRPEGVDPIEIAQAATDAIRSGQPPNSILAPSIRNCLASSSQLAEPIVDRRIDRPV